MYSRRKAINSANLSNKTSAIYKLLEDTVHVWQIDVHFDKDPVEYFTAILSSDEIIRSGKLKLQRDKTVFIVARAALRILSGKYLEKDPSSINFEYNDYGKPFYLNCSPINFNVSHSGDKIIIAFAKDRALGVDVERIKTDFDIINLANYFFSSEETMMLSKMKEKEIGRAFYRCWTRKESLIKAIGSGLSFPLNSFSVSLDQDNVAKLLETKWDSSEKYKWELFSFTPGDDYLGAIAVRGKSKSIQYYHWNQFMQCPIPFIQYLLKSESSGVGGV